MVFSALRHASCQAGFPTLWGEGAVMSFRSVIGHERPISVLRRAIESGRIAHAYLFIGPPNVGKTLVAVEFARALNCEGVGPSLFGDEPAVAPGDACGQCEACQLIERGAHPDIHVIRPQSRVQAQEEGGADVTIEGAQITTEQIGDLIAQANLKATRARRKVFVVTSAEAMNPTSANRLLKTLEEPPGDTTLILTTANPSGLLPTIISRCQNLNFRPALHAAAEEALHQRFPEVDRAQLRSVVALSGGRIGWAIRLLRHPQVLQLRAQLLDLVASLPGREWFEGMALAEKLLEAAEGWWLATEEEDFAERTLKASRDRVLRTKMNDVLDVLLTWFRDLALLSAGGDPSLVINADRLEALQAAAAGRNPGKARRACEDIEQIRQQLRGNAHLRLASEVLAFKLISAMR
jgi:DNA polymerase-3 subunit delta'